MPPRPKRLQHVRNIRRGRWIGKHRRLQIFARQTVAYREAEEIDDLFGMGADEMGTQDPVGPLFDQGLEAVDRFAEPPCRIPVRNLLRADPKYEALRPRL